MKYITTIKNISLNKTIRVYIDKETKTYIVKAKENGYSTKYLVE
ncbi:hypothetical protein [Terrisporobacter sp.]